MTSPNSPLWIAFADRQRIAQGDPRTVASAAWQRLEADPAVTLAVLDARTSVSVELDLRGTLASALQRLPLLDESAPAPDPAAPPTAPRGPGRPRLGVVAREVTLLPRHWDWLAGQRGGASVALRKLVEHALRTGVQADARRAAQESAYRFMHAMAGDEAGFEEASRALFAHDLARLRREVARWPHDVQQHLLTLAEASVAPAGDAAAQ